MALSEKQNRALASNTVTVCLLSVPPLTASAVCFAMQVGARLI